MSGRRISRFADCVTCCPKRSAVVETTDNREAMPDTTPPAGLSPFSDCAASSFSTSAARAASSLRICSNVSTALSGAGASSVDCAARGKLTDSIRTRDRRAGRRRVMAVIDLNRSMSGRYYAAGGAGKPTDWSGCGSQRELLLDPGHQLIANQTIGIQLFLARSVFGQD